MPPSPSPENPAADSFAGSSTESPYVAGPGPGFDPNAPLGEPPPLDQDPPELSPFELGWTPEQVESWLLNGGDLAHAAFGVGEHDWAMTKADLERIGPPLTRILNRFEPTRAAAAYSDAGAVAIGFGMYGWRSSLERIAVMRARERAEEQLGGTAPAPAPAEGPAAPSDFIPAAERLRQSPPPEAP